GSVTLDGSASTEMYFTGNAGKITGALSITQNSTNIISFANDGTIGGNVTISQGNTTFKNLTSAGTFNLQGGTRTINFTGLNSDPAPTLTANISLTGGTTTINGLNTLSGNINASGNATLYLSNTEVGDISFYKKTYYSWTTSIYGVKSANNISTTGDDGWHETKKMMITFADNASVKGNIATKDESITELVFSQATSATLQDSSGGAINIKAFYGAGALGNYAKNVLIFGANTTAKIGTMSSSGDYGHGVSSGATFNALNFNDDTANSASINQMNSTRSYNIVGKNLITYNTSVTYDSSLFVDDGYRKKKFNGSVAEFVKSTHSASGTFTFGDNSGETISDAIVTYIQGKNYININGNTAIKGNILSNITSSNDSNTASAGHNNLLVLTGISTTLGESGKAISIKVDNSQGQSYNKTSNNTLLLGATTNTLTLSALSASGTYNSDANQNFNALSINSGTTTATITSISAGFGTNIIGKDLITQGDSDGNGSGYNTALFGSNADTPSIQSGFIAEFVKSTHSASGNFTLGTSNTSNAISTSQGGLTYINVSGTTTIKGNILSSTQGTTGGNNNLIVLTGTSATLGESGKAISIKVENSIGDAYVRSSNNTLLLGADSNILNLSELSALGTYSSDARTNFNALSFNNTTDNGDQNIGAVKANNGSNIIGANLITQGDSDGNGSGYNTTLFGNANTPTIQRNNFASTFMSGAHTAKGTYNITSLTIENNVMGGNYINVENLNLTGNVKAHATSTVTNGDRFVENYIYTGNSGVISGEVSASRDSASTVDTKNVITFAGSGANSISGEISASAGSNNISLANNLITLGNITKSGGTNNFTFIGNGTLTLKGQTNNISTLTAYAPSTRSTSASTLVIDGTNNANSTTIDSVKNGGNLVVNFNGQGTDKSATLKISSLTGDTLKAITLGDSSTNNTLDLTALGNTTISEAISVGASQGLNINLTNTALTTNGWTTASGGASVINVGGSGVASANSTLQGKAVELSTLTLQATNGASMTLQNTSTTIGTLTSSSTSGDKLILGYNSPSITTQTNDVSATIESQVDGGNLTLVFNGGEDRSTSLTLNGAENTIQALKLGSSSGSNQSTHNTLILNKGKTTITNAINVGTNSATQEIAFNLANNTELALTGGLTKGDNGFANLNVLANSSATLSGGAVGLTNLNMGLDTSASSLTFKNTTTTIGTLTSNATASLYNTLIMGDGSSSVSVANTADNTIFDLTFNASTNNQAKTFTLTGGENSINQVLVSESDTAIANTLAVTGGSTTIDTITINSGKNLTLALNSNTDASNPSSTLVTVNSAINGANVSFSGGVNPADQIHHSTLWLKGQSNTIASIDSSASNGVILFEGTAGATITSASITSVTAPTTPADPATPSILSTPTTGGSLTFAFRGDGNSNVSVTNGITVGNGATLGISLGGSGNKVVSGNVTLETGSTLLVDFLAGNTANATLGDSNTPFTIGDGSHSIINFHGANSGNLNNGGITVASGATNTVNFLGSATLGGITLQSGATNTINVYGKSRTNQAVEGKVITSDVGAVNNTINLEDYSTLTLLSAQGGEDGSGELKTALSNTLNFLGDNATLKGGFGADTSGTATINVGQVNGANSVSGTIIGQVSNATLAFNAGTSKLTLQNLNGNAIDHTFKTITSNATDGILVFDTSKGVVNATISEGTTISEGKSLSLDFQGSNNTTVATNGGLTIDGTLGIIINGNGEKKVTSNINLNNKGTLLVDFTSGTANVTLGNGGGITIGDGESSIINFRGGKGTLANTLTLNGGTNTLNFFVDGEVGGITLTRGSNNINVEDNRTAKILDTSSVGGVSNTINLKDGATLVLRANNTASDGSGSLNTTLTNTLNFLGDGATLQGGFGAGTSEDPAQTGTATINVGDSNNSTQVVNGVITGNVTSADVTFKANNSTLTLQGATNTLNALGSSAGITGTIILDAKTDAGVNTTITTAVEATSSVGLKFGAGNKAKTFTFSETGNNLSGVEFDESGSTNNTIAFTKGSNTIANAFSITQGQGLTIALGDSTTDSSYAEGDTNTQISLALNGGFTQDGGNATLSVVGNSTADALISGGAIEVDNLDMVAKTSASLTLQNSSVSIGTLTAQKGSYALKLDALNNAVSTTIANTLNGSNLSITLAGSDATKTATLTLNGADNIIDTLSLQGTNNTLALNGSDNTIGSLTLGASSTNNTLALNNGATTISSASGVSVSSNQGITFDLANSTRLNLQALSNEGAMNATLANGSSLNITGAFSNTAGTSSITLADNSSLSTTGITNSGGSTTLALNGTSSITGGITSSDSATTAITLGESAVGKITGDIAFNGTSTA
ncbi:S-layer family protein, partial [Helicobacter brantae]